MLASTFVGDLQIGRPLAAPLNMSLSSGRFGTGREGDIRKHEGVDLLASPGTDVFSVLDGEVLDVRDLDSSGTNKRVVIEHHVLGTGIITRYLHLQTVGVSIGDFVNVGKDTLGKVGPTPTGSSSHHLHFEIRLVLNRAIHSSSHKRSSIPIDPTPFLYELDELHHGLHDTTSPEKITEFAMMRTRALEFARIRWKGAWLHLPLFGRRAYERELVETLRCAFHRGSEVRVATRSSSLLDGLDVITAVRVLD